MTKSSRSPRAKIKKAIAATAPKLAHALGGPLAGAAVEQISRVIFGAPSSNEEQLSEALSRATPEQWLALQRAEQDFALALRQADVQTDRIDAADRANARDRQRALGDRTPSLLGALIIIGFFLVLAAMLARRIPVGAETEFSIMLGALATMTAAVVNYFFGSSAGSKEKTRYIADPRMRDDA